MESYDSTLRKEPTFPSVGQPIVKGDLYKVAQTLNFSLRGGFGRSARPLARVGFGSGGTPRKALLLFSPTTPIPSTSFNSFLSYSTCNPTS